MLVSIQLLTTSCYEIVGAVILILRHIACAVFLPSFMTIEQAQTALTELELASRTQIVLWHQGDRAYTDAHHYPLNALRNKAIAVVRTTHYMVVDEGMLLSPSLFNKLNYIDRSIMHDTGALILPTLFYTPNDQIPPNCQHDITCVRK